MTRMTTVRMSASSLRLTCVVALIAGLVGAGALIAAEAGANDFQISNMGTIDTGMTNPLSNFTSDVAYNSTTNEYLVVWAGDDTGSPGGDGDFEVHGQRINAATGAEVGAEILISNTGSGLAARDANDPAVAYNAASDQFLVAWSGDPTTNDEKEIYAGRVSATGTVLDTTQGIRMSTVATDTLTDFDAVTPAVACHASTSACLIVWSGNEALDIADPIYEIYGQLVNTGASLSPTGPDDFRISTMGASDTSGLFDALTPAVAYNATSSQYLVVWSGDDDTSPQVNEEFEIFGQLVSTTGTEQGSDFRISDTGTPGSTAYDAAAPDVTYNSANGQYLVVWSADDLTPGQNEEEIFGQLLTSAGGETGTDDFRISDMGPDGSNALKGLSPAVAYHSTLNEYLVVWQGDDTADDEFEIYGQRVSASGTQPGANDFRLSDVGPDGDANFDATFPALAYSTTSREYLVVWMGDDNAGTLVNDQYEAFGQRVEFNPPTVTNVNSVADTGDGSLIEGESATVAITQLIITFSEPISNATDLANYRLINNGLNNSFQTNACGAPQGDDQAIAIDSATYLTATSTITLSVNGGLLLPPDGYRLLACATLTDADANPLDGNGNGTGGDNFVRNFSVIPLGVNADLAISKTESQDPIVLGSGNLTYTLTVVNNGPATSNSVTLTDTLPTNVAFVSVSASAGVSCTQPAGLVRCQLGNLSSGVTATVRIAVAPTASGTLTNSAIVRSATTPDLTPANNTATITTTVNPPTGTTANLAVAATAGQSQIAVGSSQIYTFTVTNGGPNSATAAQLNATIPTGLALVSATASVGSCTSNPGGSQVACSLGNLANGASATVRITVRATQVGAKSLVASVSSTTPDPVPSNNLAAQSVTVTQAKLYLPLVLNQA